MSEFVERAARMAPLVLVSEDLHWAAVPYRGWWFYIADDDQTSKTTFSLLNLLFSLQSSSGEGKSPLLTIPVGR